MSIAIMEDMEKYSQSQAPRDMQSSVGAEVTET